MRSSNRSKALTEYISARLTPEEEKRLRERVKIAGLTKSEWCRQIILTALDAGPETRLLLAEMMALRKIFLKLHADALQGQEFSPQRLRTTVDEAEATKFAMAEQRIQDFYSRSTTARKSQSPEDPAA